MRSVFAVGLSKLLERKQYRSPESEPNRYRKSKHTPLSKYGDIMDCLMDGNPM